MIRPRRLVSTFVYLILSLGAGRAVAAVDPSLIAHQLKIVESIVANDEVAPALARLTADDVITRSRAYAAWREVFDLSMYRVEDDLKQLYLLQTRDFMGSQLVGREGTGLAWSTMGVGAMNAVLPTVGHTPLTGIAILLASPPAWHILVNLAVGPQRRDARRALNKARDGVLNEKDGADLVRAVAAYDVIEDAITRHFRRRFTGPRYARLTRRWVGYFVRADRRIMKGWVLRYLETLPAPVTTGAAFQAGPMVVEIPVDEVVPTDEMAPERRVSFAHFHEDMRARPRRWRRAVRELMDELGGYPRLSARAEELLRDLDRVGPVDAMKSHVKQRAGWWCEVALANYEVALRKPRVTAKNAGAHARANP